MGKTSEMVTKPQLNFSYVRVAVIIVSFYSNKTLNQILLLGESLLTIQVSYVSTKQYDYLWSFQASLLHSSSLYRIFIRLPKLNQEEIIDLNKPISFGRTESVFFVLYTETRNDCS